MYLIPIEVILKMAQLVFILLVFLAAFSAVLSKPLQDSSSMDHRVHHPWKRFINSALTSGTFLDNTMSRLRTKRGAEEDCEKLRLCKLHAQSGRNFFSAFELYFVNKENAKLWDHQTHSIADCENRFSGCYGGEAPKKANVKTYRNEDYDYNY